MPLRRFSRETLAATPWKNGGGGTQEIVCWPPGAGLDDFGWRVSIARIAAGGPFSVFPGIDRHIMLLEGDGVHLHAPGGGVDHRLEARHQPFAFSGDAPIDCTLLGGESRDFNLMTRRGPWRGELQVLDAAAQLPAAPHGVLLVLRGEWQLTGGEDTICRDGEGLVWTESPCAWQATPRVPEARLAVACVVPA